MTTMINLEQAKRMVGTGWHPLIEELFARKGEGDVDYVKQKYGTLRIEGNVDADLQIELLDRSEKICEECGETGTPISTKTGWIYTLCGKCFDKLGYGI